MACETFQGIRLTLMVPMTSAPREIIAHSPFDEETREKLLNVFDQLQLEYGMDEDTGAQVAERILALVDGGEGSAKVLMKKAAPTASTGIEQDTERQPR